MPQVECPIAGCSYKTADLNDTVVIALINAHCAHHVSHDRRHHTKQKRNIYTEVVGTSSEKDSTLKLSLKKVTIQDLRQNPEIRGYFFGLIFCTLSLLMDIALSFSQPYWYHSKDVHEKYNSTVYVGLWRACITKKYKGLETTVASPCVNHDQFGVKEYTIVGGAQFFQCLGLIFITVAIICTSLKLFVLRETIIMNTLSSSHSLGAGISFLGSTGFVSNGLRKFPLVYDTDFGHTFSGVSGAIALVGSFTLIATDCRKHASKEKTKPNVAVEEHTYQELML